MSYYFEEFSITSRGRIDAETSACELCLYLISLFKSMCLYSTSNSLRKIKSFFKIKTTNFKKVFRGKTTCDIKEKACKSQQIMISKIITKLILTIYNVVSRKNLLINVPLKFQNCMHNAEVCFEL